MDFKLTINFINGNQKTMEFPDHEEAMEHVRRLTNSASPISDPDIVHMILMKGDNLRMRYTKPGHRW